MDFIAIDAMKFWPFVRPRIFRKVWRDRWWWSVVDAFTAHPHARFFRGVLKAFDHTAVNALNDASAFPEQAHMGNAELALRVRHVNIPISVVWRTLLDLLPALNESSMFTSFKSFRSSTDSTVLTSPPMTVFRTHITSR